MSQLRTITFEAINHMTDNTTALLPPGVAVFERGWLSSNNVLIDDGRHAVLIDTGYCTHAEQTQALVAHALGPRALDHVINTHLHSDHCGGNAALQARYPQLQTALPPGLSAAVQAWDVPALGFDTLGQSITRFRFDRVLRPGQTERWGGRDWEIHAAPGHDTHAVVLFEPESGTLISGDALWANGFGVVFPELEGEAGFEDVAATLDVIEQLSPRCVVPGHGPVFGGSDVATALARARQRLARFVQDPNSHHRHAAKVMLKYKLLEWERVAVTTLHAWVAQTAMLRTLYQLLHPQHPPPHAAQQLHAWADELLADLCRSGAAAMHGTDVING
jgi:glyoxylase-like metal-dependent hydrolase (beta-lactamase superfamily II)